MALWNYCRKVFQGFQLFGQMKKFELTGLPAPCEFDDDSYFRTGSTVSPVINLADRLCVK